MGVTQHSDMVELRDNLKLNNLLPDNLIYNIAINPKVAVNGLKTTIRIDEVNHADLLSEIKVRLIGDINCSRFF